MKKIGFTLLAASALALTATPAFAGDEERALAAIAQAQGKIDAAVRLNDPATSPELLAKAQASLRLAKESYESGKEQAAIKSAVEAQEYADTMIGETRQNANMDAQANAQTAVDAQQQAADANARADAAERAAAASAADARSARAMAAAPASTTVTTETVKPAPATRASSTRKIVRKSSAPARTSVAERTTTTVTTNN